MLAIRKSLCFVSSFALMNMTVPFGGLVSLIGAPLREKLDFMAGLREAAEKSKFHSRPIPEKLQKKLTGRFSPGVCPYIAGARSGT